MGCFMGEIVAFSSYFSCYGYINLMCHVVNDMFEDIAKRERERQNLTFFYSNNKV